MKTRKIFILFTFLLVCISCNRPDARPEEKDPIYLDILKDVAEMEKTITEKQKAFVTLQEDMKSMESRSMELKKANSQYYSSKNELFKLNQKLLYIKLRAQTRLEQDRREYSEAFKNNTEWPKRQTYEYYKQQKKLSLTPKQWTKQPYRPSGLKKETDKKPASAPQEH